MGLSESSLTTITKPFSLVYHIARYHVIHHVVLNYAEKITIVLNTDTHKMLIATAMKMKIRMGQNN